VASDGQKSPRMTLRRTKCERTDSDGSDERVSRRGSEIGKAPQIVGREGIGKEEEDTEVAVVVPARPYHFDVYYYYNCCCCIFLTFVRAQITIIQTSISYICVREEIGENPPAEGHRVLYRRKHDVSIRYAVSKNISNKYIWITDRFFFARVVLYNDPFRFGPNNNTTFVVRVV